MQRLAQVAKYLFFMGLGFGVFFYVYPMREIEALLHKLKEINYLYVIPVVAVALSSHYVRGLRWRMLLLPMGYHIKTGSAFRSIMIGYYFNTLVPRLGEVSRCVALQRIEQVPVAKSFGTVITERLSDLLMLLVVVGLTILLEYHLVGEYILELLGNKFSTLGQSLSLSVLLVAIMALALAFTAYYLLRHTRLFAKLMEMLAGFKSGLATVGKLPRPWLFIAQTAYIWLAYYVMCYLAFFTLPETASLGPIAGLVVFTLSTIGFIAPVPGGVGTYQYMFVLALALYHVPDMEAKTVAMVAFLGNTILNLLVGAISLFYNRSNQNNHAPEPGT
ncbi:MAG: flippase-like domain-containing protein [Bacteroidetes bacterium]|jgi:uncharacterized protein (TIRG00374 family)|nr:flippase-like domain-containing protein [Bacteroidota bacterium]